MHHAACAVMELGGEASAYEVAERLRWTVTRGTPAVGVYLSAWAQSEETIKGAAEDACGESSSGERGNPTAPRPPYIDTWERRAFLSLLARDLKVAAGELKPIIPSRPVLIAGDLFWEVWRFNCRRRGKPPSVEAYRHTDRVSGLRP